MIKWEYCVITGLQYKPYGLAPFYPQLLMYHPQGAQQTNLTGKNESDKVARLIAELGEQGWQMAGTFQESEGVHGIYFKRPKP